jgi:hypothetical protein
MDILPVLDQLHIPYQTEGHKHCRPGWANTECCHCTGNPGLHLGIRLDGSGAYCWRCGRHPIYQTLSKLSNTPESQVRSLARKYVGMKPSGPATKVTIRRKAFKYPSDLNGVLPIHEKYLTSRNFPVNSLIELWGIIGTGPISKLGEIDYKWRILAPIIWEGKVVSFQGRAISDKVEPKYKACPIERELIHHQHILYCHPECDWSKPVVVVEGITDVWRLGKQAVAVFGIEYLPQQVRAICKMKRQAGDRRVVVLFDDDPQAIIKGRQLVADLEFRGMDARQEIIIGDPGAMGQQEADEMMNRLMEE